MFNQTQAFREYLKRRQDAIGLEESKEQTTSNLFNERTFYPAFIKDMLNAKKEIIIYSPFVAKFRTDELKQTIEKLRRRNVEIFIFTRPIEEYDSEIQAQISCILKRYEDMGTTIFFLDGSIHEKVAIIDREILWEGSLNILSQRSSKEIMRRTHHHDQAMQVMTYIGLNRKIVASYKEKYEKLFQGLKTDSEQNFKRKMQIFLLGLMLPVIIWFVLSNLSAIKLLIQTIINVMRIFTY